MASSGEYGYGDGDPWRTADAGLDLLRMTIIASIVVGVFSRILGAGLGGAVIQLVASLGVGIMTVVALGRWRVIPRETGAQPAAATAWVGSIIGLVATLALLVVTFVVMKHPTRSSSQTALVVVAVVALVGSIMQVVGLLLSLRTAALFLNRYDLAGRALAVMIIGLIVTVGMVLVTLGAIGAKSGAIPILLTLAVLAITGLVLFIMLLSGLQSAIRERPSVAEAFS